MPSNTTGALCICSACLIGWFGITVVSAQSPIDSQSSKLLIQFGAVNGLALENHEYWKLVSSQFLHSKFPHMLLNVFAAGIFCIALEPQVGSLITIFLYLASGTIGQIASVIAYPELVSSGASQAICGIAVATLFLAKSKLTISAAITYLAIAALLDIIFAGYIKAGHIAGAVAGAILGISFYKTRSHRVDA